MVSGSWGALSRATSLAANWRVVGYDVAADRRRAMKKAGVDIRSDAAEVAREAPTLILSLPSPKALSATVNAIVEAKVRRRVVIEASTFKLEDKLAAKATLRKAGHVLLDCPVSGTGFQAEVKDLVVYASGGSAEIKRLRPLFADFTRVVRDLGEFGNGSRIKYIANLLVAIHNVASAEALVLGMKSGSAAAAYLRRDQGGCRQLGGVPHSRADDGEGPLRQADDESFDLEKRHGDHRQLCPVARRADAVIFRDAADLRRGAVDGICDAGHGLDLRRA